MFECPTRCPCAYRLRQLTHEMRRAKDWFAWKVGLDECKSIFLCQAFHGDRSKGVVRSLGQELMDRIDGMPPELLLEHAEREAKKRMWHIEEIVDA